MIMSQRYSQFMGGACAGRVWLPQSRSLAFMEQYWLLCDSCKASGQADQEWYSILGRHWGNKHIARRKHLVEIDCEQLWCSWKCDSSPV